MDGNVIELKYPIPIKKGKETRQEKFLTIGRLKVKHFELIPASLLEKSEDNKGKLDFKKSELIPLFKDLIPLIAGLFNIPEISAKEIDFEDIESVVEALEVAFPEEGESVSPETGEN